MEARASTYTASKLGALAVTTKPGQTYVRAGNGGEGEHIRFKIAHDGMEE